MAFMVELGYLTYDDVLNVVGWETIAKSDTVLGSQIRGAIFAGGVNVPADYQWTPTSFHTTPEPQSGMLLTVGLAMLMLRLKRFSAFQAADSGQALSGPIVNVPVP